jgi:geranylgeranyl pyrophosphate synthase
MTQHALALEPRDPLLDLLDREFSPDSLAEISRGAAVPWRLWSQALYTPLGEFLGRPGKQFRGELANLFYRLGGSAEPPPVELALVVEALHAGSLIIDDIEDESLERRGAPALHRLHGTPVALNAGNWLYFWPFQLLERIPLAPEPRMAAHRLLSRTLLDCHYGQALDLSVRMSELSQGEVHGVVRTVTLLKTGSLVALAAGLGAIVGGAREEVVVAAMNAGRELGGALQMLDDLSGLMSESRRHKGYEDLTHDRPTWPWAWLSAKLDAPTFEALQAMSQETRTGTDPARLAALLRERVAPHGKRWVLEAVEAALARFAEAAPSPAIISALRREVERLEKKYG